MEEPESSRLESEVRPEVTFKVPVNDAAELMVWPLIKPEVIVPEVMLPNVELPALRTVANKLVLEAVLEKKLVVVALVEVEFNAVKF